MRILIIIAVFIGCLNTYALNPIIDTPFSQEFHEGYPITNSGTENEVRAVAVDHNDVVWAATRSGLFRLDESKCVPVLGATSGPHYCLHIDTAGFVWVGAWDGAYRIEGDGMM